MKSIKKIIIWGTGLNSEHCVSCLNDDNCKIMTFVETYPEKAQFKGKCVINPQELTAIDFDCLFIASQHISEIKEELKKNQIPMDRVIDWLDYQQHPEYYPEDLLLLFSDDFLKTKLLCVQKGDFEADKEKYSREYKQLMQKEVIYVYDLRVQGFNIAVSGLIDVLINQGIKEDIGILFIPDETMLDLVWYHNLLFQLNQYCFILWEEMRPFYMEYKKQFGDKFILRFCGKLFAKPILCRKVRASRYMNFSCHFEPSILQKKVDKADSIYFFHFYSSRIGETIRRIIWLKNLPENNKRLIVLIPEDYGRTLTLGTNSCFTELINREFCMIREMQELWFWVKVIEQNFSKCVFCKDLDTNNIFRVDGELEKAVLDFLPDERLYGEQLIKQKFNLNKLEYVCICARDAQYMSEAFPGLDDSSNDCYRNHDFGIFRKAIEFLTAQGLGTVRMGQSVKTMPKYGNCIDFPNVGYDEYVDLMLHRNCKFILCGDTGGAFISLVFGRPMALLLPGYPNIGDPFINYKTEDLVIFYRYKDLKENRLLSLYETIEMYYEFVVEHDWDSRYFEMNRLEGVQPSENEVLSLAEEMNSKLDGTWVEKPEDEELRCIFNEIVDLFYADKDYNYNVYAQPTIATTFLRANREELLVMRNDNEKDKTLLL